MCKNQKLKRIKTAYKKRIAAINKSFFDCDSDTLLLFLEYMRYIRDYKLLNTTLDINSDSSAAALVAAVAEFEAYLTDDTSKAFHLSSFCELIKQNLEEWLHTNDTI